MKKLIILLCCLFSHQLGFSQNLSMPDSGRYIIHRWLQPIGEETYTVTHDNNGIQFNINFLFVDRGTRVPLNNLISLAKDFSPISYVIKGKQERTETIDENITIKEGKAFINKSDTSYTIPLPPNAFPIDGGVPLTMQVLLIKYWERHGRPKQIHGLPAGNMIEIRYRGKDTILQNGQSTLFDRYSVKNVKWITENLWLDQKGEFAALTYGFTEFVNKKYEELLVDFKRKTTAYELKDNNIKTKKEGSMVVTNANLVDVNTGLQSPASAVVVTNGVITWTGPTIKLNAPKGSKIIDAKGMMLLPGLWDMHVHYPWVEYGRALIGMGITTVRDCANESDIIEPVKRSIDKGQSIGPNILRAGLIDGTGPNTLSLITADTKEEAIDRVNKYKNEGYDQIKIYGSVKPQIVKVICDEAHRLGMNVTGHIPTGMKLLQGIDSGMNQINHLQYIFNAFEIDSSTFTIDFNKPANKNVLKVLKEKQIVVDPTLNIYEMRARLISTPVTNIYPSFYNWPKPQQAQAIKSGTVVDTIAKYKLDLRIPAYKRLVHRLFEEGIPIVAGTDNPSLPGYSLYRELEIYVDGGLTPLQAIQTATLIPAKVMGQLSQSGTIEVGKQADMIFVDGDPLKEISDIQKIKWVIKSGQVYNAAELKKSVGFK